MERPPAVLDYRVWLPVRGAADDEPAGGEADSYDIMLTPRELARKHAAIRAHRSQTGDIVDDDPDGFVIGADLLAGWLTPVERYYRRRPPGAGRSKA
jgi:hypothetical protein